MSATRFARLLALGLGLATLLVLNGPAAIAASAASTGASDNMVLASPLPGVGTRIESCVGSRWRQSASKLAGCARWAKSGPINIVLLSAGAENPYQDILSETTPRWTPAKGGWLVARLPTRGCGAAWHASEEQVELRLSAFERRHFKFIRPGCRWHGRWLTVGEAHTDAYEPQRCGGDHIADLDLARDALVASLTAGGAVSRVEYLRWRAPGTSFPDGCHQEVRTDGLVAYLWMRD